MIDYLKYLVKSVKNSSSKKVISFSVYGEDSKYLLGAIKNVDIAKKYYPGWVCRFYCSHELKDLDSLCRKDCEVLVVDSKIPPMYWRFLTADDPDVDVFISRDTDSLVNPREAGAVKEWLNSNKDMHTMHDADWGGGHFSAVMGGMWGLKLPINFNMAEKINLFTSDKNYKFRYHDDQIFLNREVLPLFKNSCLDHHSNPQNSKYNYSIPFPAHEKFHFGTFVGERISPFKMILDNEKNDLSNENLFLMPHLGPNDYLILTDLVNKLLNMGKKIVMPYKFHSKEKALSLFGSLENLKLEEIDKDSQAFSIFKNKYEISHNFVGLGNHGPSSSKKRLKERYYDQCSIELENSKSNYSTPDIKNTKDHPLVSAIVGTYNRWNFLEKTIESIKSQDYPNIEIIVINDGSTDLEYKNKIRDVIWIDLPQNSKQVCGFTCRSHVYNYGISISKGKYIAFCDDDDAWYPSKIKKQIDLMNSTRSEMSCTEGFMGKGVFNPQENYKLYHGGISQRIQRISKKTETVPFFFNKSNILEHNFIIGSSVILSKKIINKIGNLNESPRYKKGQDKEYWLRALSLTDCAFLNEPLTYYDTGHGKGRQY
jgi:GT2 family glycosyltransferase